MGIKKSKRALITLISLLAVAAIALSVLLSNPLDLQSQSGSDSLQCNQFGAGVQPRVQPQQTTSDGLVPIRKNVDSLYTEDKTPFIEQVVETRVDEFGPYAVVGVEYPSQDGIATRNVSEKEAVQIIEFLTDFAALHLIDGIYIDNTANVSEWIKQHGKEFFDDSLLQQPGDKDGEASILDRNGSPLIAAFSDEPNFETGEKVQIPFLRDGGPRVFNKKIWIGGLSRDPRELKVRASIHVSGIAVIDHSGYRDVEFSQTGRHVFYLDGENPNQFFYKRIMVIVEGAVTKKENDEWRFIESPYVESGAGSYAPMSEEMTVWRNELRVCQ
jgi:hypothetical protein